VFSEELKTDVFPISPNCYGLFPWLGTRAKNALMYSLQAFGLDVINKDSSDIILMVSVENTGKLKAVLNKIKVAAIDVNALPVPVRLPKMGKYGEYVPSTLAKKQFLDNFLDIDEMQKELQPILIT
jgi:hypothetical protein